MRAYRQDLTVMADLLTAGRQNDIALTDITKNMMRYRIRCLRVSTRAGFDLALLVDVECVVRVPVYRRTRSANPMAFVGRPNAAKTPPRSRPDRGPQRIPGE